MAQPTFERESTAEGVRQQMLGLVEERRSLSETHFSGIRKEFPQLYDLYRGIYTGRWSPHKNTVHIPLIFSTIQSDVARKTQTSFGAWPIVRFVGYGPNDAIIARKREALISAQMRDCQSFHKAYDLFLSADLYGTAIARYGWNYKEENMEVLDVQAMPLTGRIIETARRENITTFDGPDWKVLDCLDIFPQPNYRLIDDMLWFEEREYLDFDDIRALSMPNVHGKAIFDKSVVDDMAAEGAGAYLAADEYKQWRTQSRTLADNDARMREKYARPVELIHMWGVIPSELAEDGVVNRVITIANGRYVLRDRPNPFWHSKKPYIAYSPMPDPHFFFAPGKAEVAKKLQIVANRFTNQQLDALDIFIDPVFFYNSQSGLKTRNLFMRPGKFIEMDGNPNEMLSPLIPNLTGVQMGSAMTEQVWRWMQQGSGIIEDTVQGGQGQQQTARQYLGRAEAVATRLLMESRIFEESFLEPLADAFVDLNRQFMTKDREVWMLGENAILDPVTGEQIPDTTRMESQMVTAWDLVPNYDSHAVGSTQQLGKVQRQQNITFLMQAASANPIAASAVNWINFFRQVFREFDMENVNELIATPQQMQKMLEMQKGGAPEDQQNEVPGSPNSLLMSGALPNQAGNGL